MALRSKINVSPSDQRDVSSQVRAMTTSVRVNAEEGSVAMSTIVIDDPDGTLDVPGLKEIYGQETEATLPTFFRGIIADRGVSRGETDKSFRTTTARQWEVQVADQRAVEGERVAMLTRDLPQFGVQGRVVTNPLSDEPVRALAVEAAIPHG